MRQHQPETPASASANSATAHWQRSKRLTLYLLASWFILSFGVLFFARELASISWFGWPLSFYMAAQGLSLLYVLIVGIYSLCARRIENLSQPQEQAPAQAEAQAEAQIQAQPKHEDHN